MHKTQQNGQDDLAALHVATARFLAETSALVITMNALASGRCDIQVVLRMIDQIRSPLGALSTQRVFTKTEFKASDCFSDSRVREASFRLLEAGILPSDETSAGVVSDLSTGGHALVAQCLREEVSTIDSLVDRLRGTVQQHILRKTAPNIEKIMAANKVGNPYPLAMAIVGAAHKMFGITSAWVLITAECAAVDTHGRSLASVVKQEVLQEAA